MKKILTDKGKQNKSSGPTNSEASTKVKRHK